MPEYAPVAGFGDYRKSRAFQDGNVPLYRSLANAKFSL
jgi:hypothetical protein